MKLKVESDPANLWRLKLKTHGVSDGYVAGNTFAANGGTSGWHSHPGPSVIFVTAGTIVVQLVQAGAATRREADDPSS
jgi:quercetin dioxygenase-like cupin family protein